MNQGQIDYEELRKRANEKIADLKHIKLAAVMARTGFADSDTEFNKAKAVRDATLEALRDYMKPHLLVPLEMIRKAREECVEWQGTVLDSCLLDYSEGPCPDAEGFPPCSLCKLLTGAAKSETTE